MKKNLAANKTILQINVTFIASITPKSNIARIHK